MLSLSRFANARPPPPKRNGRSLTVTHSPYVFSPRRLAQGLDKCNEALEPHVSLADAEEMLKIAGDKFQEAAALALFNWGNVHMCGARKAMDGGRDPPLEEGGPPGAAIASAEKYDEVVERLDDAKGRYEAALKVKPDFHDAKIALAQRRYERARLLCAAAGLSGEAGVKASSVVPTLVPVRPRWRGERRSLRTFAVASLRAPLAFNPCARRLSTPTDAFELHPDVRFARIERL